jgi:hypothetical protein
MGTLAILVVSFSISFGGDAGVSGLRSAKVPLSQAQCDDAKDRAEIPPEVKLLAARGKITRLEHYCVSLPVPKVAAQ